MAMDITREQAKELIHSARKGMTWEELGFSSRKEFEAMLEKAIMVLNSKVKLSIIIPVYNGEKYLKRCFDSIESREGVEVIVIEDGSEDEAKNICARENGRFIVEHHLTNWGPSISRNDGIRYANGEYITFLDSDDEYLPGAIDKMLDAVDRYKERPIIQYNHQRWPAGADKPVSRYNNPRGYYDILHRPNRWEYVWNKIYKRSFLIENGIDFTPHSLRFGEDEIFVLRCLATGASIYNVDEETVIKHFDNESSICHVLTDRDLTKMCYALEQFLLESEKPEVRKAIREIMARHWDSPLFKKHFEN